MTDDPSPAVPGAVLTDDEVDPFWAAEFREQGEKQCTRRIPHRFTRAVVTVPEVAGWVRAVVDVVRADHRTTPRIVTGPSLMLVGSTGTGKSYQCWGAIRALSASGAGCSWLFTTAADLYGALRPRPRVDSEDEFDRYARVGLLVLDDFGAAKTSEWNEEINYRLINYRYEREMPTLITSNVPPKDLPTALGERVASRVAEMADRVVLRGGDRRIAKGSAA